VLEGHSAVPERAEGKKGRLVSPMEKRPAIKKGSAKREKIRGGNGREGGERGGGSPPEQEPVPEGITGGKKEGEGEIHRVHNLRMSDKQER